MAEAFQIVCADRSETSRRHLLHITGVGAAPKPGSPSHWPITSVLEMLALGNLFYAINDLGDPVFVRHYRCECGFETIRTTADDETTDTLDSLPICDWPDRS